MGWTFIINKSLLWLFGERLPEKKLPPRVRGKGQCWVCFQSLSIFFGWAKQEASGFLCLCSAMLRFQMCTAWSLENQPQALMLVWQMLYLLSHRLPTPYRLFFFLPHPLPLLLVAGTNVSWYLFYFYILNFFAKIVFKFKNGVIS